MLLSWTLVWWAADGIGLIIWGALTSEDRLRLLGSVEVLYAALIGLAISGVAPSAASMIALLIVVPLIVARTRVGFKQRWSRRWKSLGEPEIWPRHYAALAVIVLLLAGATHALNVTSGFLKPIELSICRYLLGSILATLAAPGANGLAANRFTRWFLRISAAVAVWAAFVLVASRVVHHFA